MFAAIKIVCGTALGSDSFDTECDVDGEDSTVLVDEFYNTDCGVTDDDKEVIEELDQVSISLISIALSIFKDR